MRILLVAGEASGDLQGEQEHIHQDQGIGDPARQGEAGSIGVDLRPIGDSVSEHLEREVDRHDPVEARRQVPGGEAGAGSEFDGRPPGDAAAPAVSPIAVVKRNLAPTLSKADSADSSDTSSAGGACPGSSANSHVGIAGVADTAPWASYASKQV